MFHEAAVNISQMGLRRLRTAIQNQEVSFPAQVPVFACQSRADIQWRAAELYFVHNWSCSDLGKRYGITMERVRQLVSQWTRRAAVLGYLQEIPPAGVSRDDIGAQHELAPPPSAVDPGLLSNRQVYSASSGH
jgi:hypothetical protein